MTLAAIVAALPIAAVLLLLDATRWQRNGAPAFMAALAIGLGIGAGSLVFFLSLIVCNGARSGLLALDCALLLSSTAFWWSSPPAAQRLHARVLPPSAWNRVLLVGVAVAGLAGAAAFAANSAANPHGEWDAWAIWNARARWLFRAGASWRRAFGAGAIHGDYPLLLPGAVARLWVYAGSDATAVPAALAATYALALALLLYGALTAIRGRTTGLLGALCLLGTPFFLTNAAWQYADLPLAFYLLAALALFAVYDHTPDCRGTMLVWAGASAGLAAWTKNEGLWFVLCLIIVRAAALLTERRRRRAPAAWFSAGLLLPIIAVAYFKLTLAPPTYELAGRHIDDLLARLGDVTRYAAIVRAAAVEFVNVGGPLPLGLLLYAVLLGATTDRPARRAARAVALVLAAVAIGYAGIYLITPADLAWQLSHSVNRLILQLWPSALFAFFLFAASPVERAVPARIAASARLAPGAESERRPRGARLRTKRPVGVASPPVAG